MDGYFCHLWCCFSCSPLYIWQKSSKLTIYLWITYLWRWSCGILEWLEWFAFTGKVTIHIFDYNCGFHFYIILVELFLKFHCFFRPIDVTTSLFDFHICLDGTNFYQISTSLDYMGCFGSHFIMGFICW